MSRRFKVIAAVAALGLPCGAGNEVHEVSPAGPFFDVQSAVNAAADGDVVLIRAGSYGGFVVDDKELGVIGDAGSFVSIAGEIRVLNLDADRVVQISGLDVTGVASHALLVRDCAGLVRVQGCRLEGSYVAQSCNFPTPTFEAARIERASGALLSSSVVESYPEPAQQPCANWGGTGLYAEGSNVALYETTARGGKGGRGQSVGIGPEGDGGPGGHGCVLPDSFLFSSASSFIGGDGGDGGDGMTCTFGKVPGAGGPGGDGLRIGAAPAASSAAILLDFYAQRGNSGKPGLPQCGQGWGPKGKPVRLIKGSVKVLGTPGLRMTLPHVAREGQTVPIALTGTPGDVVHVYVGGTPHWYYSSARSGVVALRRPFVLRLDLGPIPASGALNTSLILPPLPGGVEAETWYLQPVALPPGDGLNTSYVGTPLALVRLDQSF